MKLVTFRADIEASARAGSIHDGLVVDIAALGAARGEAFPATMLRLIDAGPAGLGRIARAVAAGDWPMGVARPLEDVRLLAPIPRPRKNIFGIGLNYAEHTAESARALDTAREMPQKPVIFTKPPTAVIGPGDPIPHDGTLTRQLDWEVELAVIIGRTARRTPEARAMEHVFGYTVMVDVSARDCRRAGQWIYSKGMDGYAPMGPCIVTADEIPDPHELDLWLKKNGEVKQASNTRHMHFRVPALIADISAGMTLEPGDIIATGTPEGVGAGRTPQEWMWPGDVIDCGVNGIGTLSNPVIDARPAGDAA